MMAQNWSFLKDCTGNCSSYKTKANLEISHHISWIKGEADAFFCHFYISVCLCIVDIDTRFRKKNAGFWDEMLPNDKLNISYKSHISYKDVRRKIQSVIGEYDELL